MKIATLERALALTLWIAALTAALASPAAAQPREEPLGGLYGISVGAGIAKPAHLSSALGFLARLDLGGYQGVSLLPTIEYWGQSSQALGTKVSNHDVTTGLDLRYRIGSGPTRPYAGGGVALHFLSSKIQESERPEISESSVKLGATVLGGVEFKQTESFSWFVEGKVRLVSRFTTWKALAGVTYSP
jgi:hypothetical protein